MISAGRIPGSVRVARPATRWERFRAWRGRLWGTDVRETFIVQAVAVNGRIKQVHLSSVAYFDVSAQPIEILLNTTSDMFGVGDTVFVEMTITRKGK